MAERVERDSVGAWLVRCNPRVWDLERYWRDAGGGPIRFWSVGDNYRSRMMHSGDRILLWVGGQSPTYERGIWGDGLVTGKTQFDVAASDEAISPYWRNPETGKLHQNFSRVRITPLINSPVTDQTLRKRGITDLEVQRQPQGVSPSWVTKQQLEAIDQAMREQPDPGLALARSGGGRFGSPAENQEVEQAAVSAVTDFYEAGGWSVEDVSVAKVGWDLTCTKGRRTARVEVKGVRGTKPIVFLTANELRAAQEDDDWYLAVVTRALDDAAVTEYTAQAAVAAALPYAYRANLQID